MKPIIISRILKRLWATLQRWRHSHREYQVETTAPDGFFRVWQDGFSTLEKALEFMEGEKKSGRKWERHMPNERVEWRVAEHVVLYHEE